jgi:hypothetical protein
VPPLIGVYDDGTERILPRGECGRCAAAARRLQHGSVVRRPVDTRGVYSKGAGPLLSRGDRPGQSSRDWYAHHGTDGTFVGPIDIHGIDANSGRADLTRSERDQASSGKAPCAAREPASAAVGVVGLLIDASASTSRGTADCGPRTFTARGCGLQARDWASPLSTGAACLYALVGVEPSARALSGARRARNTCSGKTRACVRRTGRTEVRPGSGALARLGLVAVAAHRAGGTARVMRAPTRAVGPACFGNGIKQARVGRACISTDVGVGAGVPRRRIRRRCRLGALPVLTCRVAQAARDRAEAARRQPSGYGRRDDPGLPVPHGDDPALARMTAHP